MPSTSYAKLRNKINYFPPSHKMQTTMWDPLTTNTTLCGTTLRNTKITTLLLHYPRKHVLTHPQTNESGRKDLLPSTPLTGTALGVGHHLSQHPLSPYDEKSAQDVAKFLPRMKEQASAATTTTHPLFMTPFTPEELKNEIKNCFQTIHQAPLALPTECYKLVTLISKD